MRLSSIERFDSPKDLKEENEYAGLEDADEFSNLNCDNPGCDEVHDLSLCNRCGAMWCDYCLHRILFGFGLMQRNDPNQPYQPGHVHYCPNCKDLNESNNEYAGLEDNDEFQEEEEQYHPFLNQLEYTFLGSRWPEHEIIAPRPDFPASRDQYYIKGSTVFKNGTKIGLTSGPVPFDELTWTYRTENDEHGYEPWSWNDLINELYNIFGPNAYDDDPPPGVGI